MIYYLLLTTIWGLAQSRLESHFGKGVEEARPEQEPDAGADAEAGGSR